MSRDPKDQNSTDNESTKSQADSPTSKKMSEDEFLKILTETQWPADLSDEENEEGIEEDLDLDELPDDDEILLKPEQVRAALETWPPGQEDLKRELLAELEEYEAKKKEK